MRERSRSSGAFASASDQFLVGFQNQRLEQIIGQALGPALEDLEHHGPRILLHLQIIRGAFDKCVQYALALFRIGIGIGASRSAFALTDGPGLSVQHIGRNGPGSPCKADERLGRVQLRTDQ